MSMAPRVHLTPQPLFLYEYVYAKGILYGCIVGYGACYLCLGEVLKAVLYISPDSIVTT